MLIRTWPRFGVFVVLDGVCALTAFVPGALLLLVFAIVDYYAPRWWTCPRCGAHQWRRFGWAHRPASNPGIRTCGGNPVHFWRVKRARQREIEAARRVALMLMARESGRWRG